MNDSLWLFLIIASGVFNIASMALATRPHPPEDHTIMRIKDGMLLVDVNPQTPSHRLYVGEIKETK